MKLKWISLCLTLLLTFAKLTAAQVQTGLPQFAAMQGGPDTINLANLNVHFAMPIEAKPGRKLPFTYSFSYDSSVWSPVNSSGQSVWTPAAGFGFTTGLQAWNGLVSASSSENCVYIPPPYGGFYICYGTDDGYAYKDANATVHPTTFVYSWACTPSCSYNSSGSLTAEDDSGYTVSISATSVSDLVGNLIFTAAGGQGTAGSIEDTNGNYISANTSGSNIIVTDTLGSNIVTIPPSSCTAPCTPIYTVPTGTVGITYYSYPIMTNFGCSGVAEYGPTNQNLPYDIILPDGTAYVFLYENTPGHTGYYTGRIAEIALPTGGDINYTYTGGNNGIHCGDGSAAGLTRTGPDGTWTYTRSFGSGAASTTTISDPQNDLTVVNFQGIYPTETQIYQGASTLMQTLLTCYNGTAPSGNPATCNSSAITLPITSRTSYVQWPGTTVLESETNTNYNGYGQPTETDEYGYGSGSVGPLQRKTTFSYGTLNRPTSVTIANGTGTTVAQTNITYDSNALNNVAGSIAQHDTTYGTSKTVRGNATLIQNLVAGSTFVSSSAAYDITGQHVSDTDSNGNVTSYRFSDNYFTDNGQNPPQTYSPTQPTNAFVTSVNSPLIGQSETHGYYFNTGNEALASDQNGATTYKHYDGFGRLTGVYLPASSTGYPGWTLVTYPSGSEQDYYTGITTPTASTSCTSCRHTQVFLDSLGRVSSTVLASDPDGATTIGTTYDSLGRVETVTNPYRSTSDPTYGIETYGYDVLNRNVLTEHPDFSQLNSYYGLAAVGAAGGAPSQLCSSTTYGVGYPILFADSSGNKQQSWSDALNRLIEQDEPNSSGNLNVATCYLYDPLGDLTQVVQGSQTRSYTYDGLGRVASETTPEAGTVSVSYTNSSGGLCSGNPVTLCRRTDARGITQTNTYDGLNRLTSTSFSDGQTATMQYFYDQTSYNGLSITNGKGHATGMSDGSGTSAFSYDILGQIVAENHTINGNTKSMSYYYNLDGSPEYITYPSGRTVVYEYSNAQRPISAIDASTGVSYASSAHYAPQGFLSFVNLGFTSNFAGISEGYSFNNRLQLTGVSASSSNGTALNLQYGMPASPNNNNLIQSMVNNVDNGRTMSVTYDSLNRLQTAQSQATSGPDCWGQSYGYDRWANLLSVTVTQCTGSGLSVGVTNNQITNSGFLYDAAGDMTSDSAYSYTYDGAGRLSSAGGVNYTYDGHDQRVEKSSGTIYWRGFSGDTYTESNLSGSVTSDYVFFDGQRTARIDSSGNVYYYFQDKLNSVRAIANSSGNVCYSADFTPFGGEIAYVNTCPQNYKFTDYERDSESGLDYANFRYFDNRIGRFTSPDHIKGTTAKPQSLNRYSYVLNDPCNLVDPTGLCDVVAGGFTDPNKNIGPNITNFASSDQADMAFPYSGENAGQSFLSSFAGTSNTVLNNAITSACTGGPCNLFLFSGSAQTFANIYSSLPTNIQSNINNVVYLSPGLSSTGTYNGTSTLPKGSGQTVAYFNSNDPAGSEAVLTSSAEMQAKTQGIPVKSYPDTSCQGHSAQCAFNPANNLGQYKGTPCPNPEIFDRQDLNGVPYLAAYQQMYTEILEEASGVLQSMWDAAEALASATPPITQVCVSMNGGTPSCQYE